MSYIKHLTVYRIVLFLELIVSNLYLLLVSLHLVVSNIYFRLIPCIFNFSKIFFIKFKSSSSFIFKTFSNGILLSDDFFPLYQSIPRLIPYPSNPPNTIPPAKVVII